MSEQRAGGLTDLSRLGRQCLQQQANPFILAQFLVSQIDAADMVNRAVMHLPILNEQIEMIAAQFDSQPGQRRTTERPAALIGAVREVRQQLLKAGGELFGLLQSAVVFKPQIGCKNVEGKVFIESTRIKGTGHVPSLAPNAARVTLP
ncbi:hypothetical protein GCM10008957_44330 [Deinococcus ruber]|uniref:Uncharacterized protein n=1 Tax=Deinococcus ruber TaxID=1848197 RepID=A0A918CJS8_9DEIO|nr:hypothetical protein GCM10008957_44330 [Deinococcus ruber]